MQVERLNLSELNTPSQIQAPTQAPPLPDLNAYDSVRNNKTIENMILEDRSVLSNLDVATSLQRINDLEGQYDLVQSQLSNVLSSVASQAGGRGITGIGVRNLAATRAAQLEEQRARLAAQISYLRGNVSTANALASRARATGTTTDKVDAYKQLGEAVRQEEYKLNEEANKETQAAIAAGQPEEEALQTIMQTPGQSARQLRRTLKAQAELENSLGVSTTPTVQSQGLPAFNTQ